MAYLVDASVLARLANTADAHYAAADPFGRRPLGAPVSVRLMYLKRRIALAGLIVAALALASCSTREAVALKEYPESWQLDELAAAVPHGRLGVPQVQDTCAVHVLAWKIVRDARPLTLEQCLLLEETRDPQGRQHWVLAGLARSDSQGKPGPWEVEAVHYNMPRDSGIPHHWKTHVKAYDARPANEDIYKFMDDIAWQLGADRNWRLLDGMVCRQAWGKAIGQEPTRLFPGQ
jgi:hypothetical protein